MTGVALSDADRVDAQELAPVLRRAVDLDARALARLRWTPLTATVLVRLPFGVLVSRTVARERPDAGHPAVGDPAVGDPAVGDPAVGSPVVGDPAVGDPAVGSPVVGTRASDTAAVRDVTVGAAQLLARLDGPPAGPADDPPARDSEWRGAVPPASGWARLETVPDDVVRPLVRQGALTLRDAAAREGVPGAQPRQEVADALLDSPVLRVQGENGAMVEVTLRAVSALTRMGFLPRGGSAHVDVAGRWIRLVGGYGSVYLERPGVGLTMVRSAADPR